MSAKDKINRQIKENQSKLEVRNKKIIYIGKLKDQKLNDKNG